jgi:hypothetical protein
LLKPPLKTTAQNRSRSFPLAVTARFDLPPNTSAAKAINPTHLPRSCTQDNWFRNQRRMTRPCRKKAPRHRTPGGTTNRNSSVTSSAKCLHQNHVLILRERLQDLERHGFQLGKPRSVFRQREQISVEGGLVDDAADSETPQRPLKPVDKVLGLAKSRAAVV